MKLQQILANLTGQIMRGCRSGHDRVTVRLGHMAGRLFARMTLPAAMNGICNGERAVHFWPGDSRIPASAAP
jgi:hypothetical protein